MIKIFSKPNGESWRSIGPTPKQLINSFIPQEMKIYYYILNVKQIFAINSKFIKELDVFLLIQLSNHNISEVYNL